MNETRKTSDAPIATLQYFLGLASGKLSMMSKKSLFTASFADTIADIKEPGIYRLRNVAALPDGSSMDYNVTLCLKAGADMYLLTMTHVGTAAFGFLNNGTKFHGWTMLT